MKVNYSWLQKYFDKKLPLADEVAEILTFHSFEIEGIEKKGGETIIDVDVLPNRAGDSMSHYGIAKELSVILNSPLKEDIFKEERNLSPESKLLSVEILDKKLCRRFTGAVIKNIEVKKSPDWLKESLESLGQKSINNIVDATNYVMFNIGQPLHAFDMDKLKESNGVYNITVRNAENKEEITTLTGDKYSLNNENLLITDGNSKAVLGIAGIKGGKLAEVNEKTNNIIIECANFEPINIRKSSQFLKLRTDASARFENNISPEVPLYGITEVVKLILDIAGGELEGYVDEYPAKQPKYKVGVSVEEVNKLLGSSIKENEMEDILNRFGFEYEKVSSKDKVLELAKNLEGKPYKYGASITNDAPKYFDCSSFTGYLFVQAGVSIPRVAIDQYVFGSEVGKDNIKPGDLVFSTNGNGSKVKHKFKMLSDDSEVTHVGPKEETFEFALGTKVKGGVSHCGLYLGNGEVIHASSDDGVILEKINESKHFKNIVGYRSMLSSDTDRYVITVPFERRDIKIKEDIIEEIGRIYGYKNIKPAKPEQLTQKVKINKNFYYSEKIRNFLTEKGFSEVYNYSFTDSGEVELINFVSQDKKFLRNKLSSGLEKSLNLNIKNAPLLGLENINIFEIGTVFKDKEEHISCAIGFAGKKAKLYIEETIEELLEYIDGGKLKYSTDQIDNKDLFIIEFNLSKLIKTLPEKEKYDKLEKITEGTIFSTISQYPFVLRDIAVWVPKNIEEKDLIKIFEKESGNLLVNTTLFDVYKKEELVSYAFHLVYQSNEKTLSDEKINKIMDKITETLNSNEGFEVR